MVSRRGKLTMLGWRLKLHVREAKCGASALEPCVLLSKYYTMVYQSQQQSIRCPTADGYSLFTFFVAWARCVNRIIQQAIRTLWTQTRTALACFDAFHACGWPIRCGPNIRSSIALGLRYSTGCCSAHNTMIVWVQWILVERERNCCASGDGSELDIFFFRMCILLVCVCVCSRLLCVLYSYMNKSGRIVFIHHSHGDWTEPWLTRIVSGSLSAHSALCRKTSLWRSIWTYHIYLYTLIWHGIRCTFRRFRRFTSVICVVWDNPQSRPRVQSVLSLCILQIHIIPPFLCIVNQTGSENCAMTKTFLRRTTE